MSAAGVAPQQAAASGSLATAASKVAAEKASAAGGHFSFKLSMFPLILKRDLLNFSLFSHHFETYVPAVVFTIVPIVTTL
jgi:hypothetical protein